MDVDDGGEEESSGCTVSRASARAFRRAHVLKLRADDYVRQAWVCVYMLYESWHFVLSFGFC